MSPAAQRPARLAAALALGAEAILLAVDVVAGPDAILTGAYLLPPLALAVVAPARVVAAVAALGFCLAFASGTWNDYFLSGDHVVRLFIVGCAGALAVFSARGRRATVLAREEAELQRRRMAVLAAVARLPNERSLDRALDRLTREIVPAVADLAFIELVPDRERGKVSAVAANGPGARELEAWTRERPATGEGDPTQEVIRTGRTRLIEAFPPELIDVLEKEADRELVRGFGPRSSVIVPLRAGDRVLGALGVTVGPSGRAYGHEDARYFETLAGRAALAIANAQLVDELTTTRRRLDGILGSLAEAVTVHDANGRTIYANAAAATLLGSDEVDDVLATGTDELAARFEILREDGTPAAVEDFPGQRLMAGLPAPPVLTRSTHRASGRTRWMLTKATLLDEGGERLAVNVIEDVTEQKEAERRQRFRAEAGQVFASSLDGHAILERLAELVVPALADWCVVHLCTEEAELEVVAAAGDPPDLGGLPGAAARNRAREQREGILSAPMRSGDEVLGTLTVGRADPLGEADAGFLEDIALRAGAAVETARLYEAQARVADTLQRSLLPERLIEVPGWEAGASYEAGERGATVGGDFYDVIPAGGDHLVVLGDVTGRGVQAAALTSLVRHTVRTAVRYDPRPGAIVALLNQVLYEQPTLAPVTLVCALIPGAEGSAEVTLCVAGHPLPLLKRAVGPPVEVGAHDIVLGVSRRAGTWSERTIAVGPGETLLFYTDGVIDTPGVEQRFGEGRLAGVVERAPADPRGLLTAVDAELRRFEARSAADDRAMLALRHVGPAQSAPADVWVGAAA